MNKALFKKLFLHFFPLTCPSCKKNPINKISEICNSCYSKLSFISEPYCKSCGGNNNTIFDVCSNCMQEDKNLWLNAISVLEMKDLSRDLIIRYKYYKEIPLARFFSTICCQKISETDINIDVITHIPLHWLKYLKRGFNQSSLLEKLISKQLGISSKTLLRRNKYTKSQTKLTTKNRRKNIIGSIKAINTGQIKNKKILLIDDVYTTGSTLREASKILLNAGAYKIYVFTLARR